MNLRVGRVVELIRPPVAAVFRQKRLRLFHRRSHSAGGRGEDQGCAKRAHQKPAFKARGFGHDDRAAITAGSSHVCQSDAGVAAGGFQQDTVFVQKSALLGIVDHADGDAILDTVGGIEELQFGQDFNVPVGVKARKPHQGCFSS